jgi:hypothetical protein
MTAPGPLRKNTPRAPRPAEARPAFHPPANDNSPVVSRRLLAWGLMALGFAAMVIVLASGA